MNGGQEPKPIGNRLLSSLPDEEFALLQPHLEVLVVHPHQVLVEPNAEIEYVFFPTSCMISLVTVLDNGVIIESATIGNEGMSGLAVFHGLKTSPSRAIVQMEGETNRLRASVFKALLAKAPALSTALGRYADALISMLAQSGACNGQHTVEQRFARWLLTIRDRTYRSEFTITQEFLGQMLGSHRPTVTVAAQALQRAGLITYRHGYIRLLNRAGLEELACECYGIIRELYSYTYQTKAGR
jgi:CRP-like cAMP-binding protein